MAVAKNLRVTHTVRDGVKVVDGKVERVEGKVEDVGDKVEEIGDKVEDVGGKLEDVAGQVEDVGGKIEDMGDKVEGMGDKVEGMVDKVEGVGDKVDDLGNKVDHIGDRVEDIGDIVEDIGDKVQGVDENVQVVIEGARCMSGQSPILTNIFSSEGKEAKLILKQTANDVDEIKCSSSSIYATSRPSHSNYPQGTSCYNSCGFGSLPRIRQQITTLHERPNTRERPYGSFKAVSSSNGSRLAPSCGSTENVRSSHQFRAF